MPEKTFEQILIERDNYTPEDAETARHEALERMIWANTVLSRIIWKA